MSTNCIKTTLLSSIDNANLPKLGEAIIRVEKKQTISYPEQQQGLSVIFYTPATISVDGNGYFATTLAGLDNPSSRMTELTAETNRTYQLYFKNDDYTIYLSNKYELRQLLFPGRNNSNRSIFIPDMESFKYALETEVLRFNGEFYADISAFSLYTMVKEINIINLKITGKLSNLPQISTLQTISFSATDNQLTGSLSDLSALSGLKVISMEDANITGNLSSLSPFLITSIVLGNTQVGGDLSSLSVHASRITKIFLNDTQVTGDIADLGTLAACTYMRFERTSVTGTIESVASAAATVRSSGTLIVDTTGTTITYNGNVVPTRATITFTGSGNYSVAVS